jgi:integrase/recombinase XerD
MTLIPRHAVPLNDWPPTDQAMWQTVIADGDIFDGQGPGANWASSTIDNTRKAYGYWLHWLGINGLLSPPVDHPLDRITEERIKSYIEDMQDNSAPLTRFVYVLDLLRFVQVAVPDRNWDWLKSVKNKLWARAVPSRDKVPLIRNSRDLFELGLDLMNDTSGITCRYNPLQAEVQYRDGLLIAILASRPVRLKNLTSIEINRHLIRIDTIYWLVFEAGEVKNRRHIEVPIPGVLSSYIDDYVSNHRPLLMQDNPSDCLWISRFGGDLTCNSVRRQIKKHTEEAFGKPITPHLFRDCVATSIAIHDPEHVWITSNILGHHTLVTSQKYYDQSRMLEAGRHYQSTISDLHRTLKEEARSPYKSASMKGP